MQSCRAVIYLASAPESRLDHTSSKTSMKAKTIAAVLVLVLAGLAFAADESVGSIDFKGAPVQQVLDLYKALSGLDLFVDSRVKTIPTPIKLQFSGTKLEALKRIEKALLEQSRIVITHLDEKRVSVTYNDALPIARSEKEQGR